MSDKKAFDASIGAYSMYVPVDVQESEQLVYNDEIRVTLYGPEETVTFKSEIGAGFMVGTPADIQRLVGLTPGANETCEVVVEKTGTRWQGETPMETRSSYRKEVRTLGE